MVADPIIQNTVKKRLPFLGGTARIAAHQTNHRILHDIHGVIRVTHAKTRHTQGFTLDLAQETVHFAGQPARFLVFISHRLRRGIQHSCDRHVLHTRYPRTRHQTVTVQGVLGQYNALSPLWLTTQH